jgi:hypothetical protein
MPRTRRYLRSGRPYELDIRVKSGLPFACVGLIKLLLQSAIARAQRDDKIKICHHHWQGNHLHMLLIPFDAEQCVFFYQELQKKITEAIKRLLGVRRLNLWEGDPILAEVLDIEKTIDRIVYYYANPTEADLVDSIEEYPGLSSWQDFMNSEIKTEAKITNIVPWVRLPSIPTLTAMQLSPQEDTALCKMLTKDNPLRHELTVYPYAWLSCFGEYTPEEVGVIKARIIKKVRELENVSRARRAKAKRRALGAASLKRQPIMAKHTPPPRERRVYVLASDATERIDYIENMKEFCTQCSNLYQDERAGRDHVQWPPGAVRPARRPIANAIADIGVIMQSMTYGRYSMAECAMAA